MESIRLNKYLSEAGVCSRREADRLAQEGKILVDGAVAEVGMKVFPSQHITIEGKAVRAVEKKVLLAVNKPRGIECTAQRKVKNNIVNFVNYPVRVYPVGRLDKDSQGLILMTNQGDLVNKMMRAGNYHEKEYVVTLDRPLTPEFLAQMREGVPVLNTVTRRCRVWQTKERTFHIVLTQGLNRQIRRMCEYLGYRVRTLKRIRIMNIHLGDLPEGQYRKVTEEEWRELMRQTAHSSSTTVYDKK